MNLFLLTMRYLTVLPVGRHSDKIFSKDEFAKGIVFFPVIGLIVGLLSYVAYFLGNYVSWGGFACLLVVLTQIILTGAFHLDGLADSCDALFSARKKERMLEIMKDSRIGTNGVVAVIFDVALKVSLLNSMDYRFIFPAIVLMPAVGETAVALLADSVYARKEGLGDTYIGRISDQYFVITLSIGFIFSVLIGGIYGVLPFIAVAAAAFLFRKFVEHKIGGMTGDTLGAGVEIAEVVFLVALSLERWLYF